MCPAILITPIRLREAAMFFVSRRRGFDERDGPFSGFVAEVEAASA
jgi:hypothetical protein